MYRVLLFIFIIYSTAFACLDGGVTETECQILDSWNKSSWVYSASTIGRVIEPNLKECLKDQMLTTFSDTICFIIFTQDSTTCMGKFWNEPNNLHTDIPMIVKKHKDYKGENQIIDTIDLYIFSMCPRSISNMLDSSLVFVGGNGYVKSYSKEYVDTLNYVLRNQQKISIYCNDLKKTNKNNQNRYLDELD